MPSEGSREAVYPGPALVFPYPASLVDRDKASWLCDPRPIGLEGEGHVP